MLSFLLRRFMTGKGDMFPFIMIMSLGKVHVPVAMHPTHLSLSSQKDGPPTRKKKNETLFLPSTAKSCEEGEEKKKYGDGSTRVSPCICRHSRSKYWVFLHKKKNDKRRKNKKAILTHMEEKIWI